MMTMMMMMMMMMTTLVENWLYQRHCVQLFKDRPWHESSAERCGLVIIHHFAGGSSGPRFRVLQFSSLVERHDVSFVHSPVIGHCDEVLPAVRTLQTYVL